MIFYFIKHVFELYPKYSFVLSFIFSYLLIGLSSCIILNTSLWLDPKTGIINIADSRLYRRSIVISFLLWPLCIKFIPYTFEMDIFNIIRLIQGKGIYNIMKDKSVAEEFYYFEDNKVKFKQFSDINGIEIDESYLGNGMKEVFIKGLKTNYKQLVPEDMKIDQNTFILMDHIISHGIPMFENVESGVEKNIVFYYFNLDVTFPEDVYMVRLYNNFVFIFDKKKKIEDYSNLSDGLIAEYTTTEDGELISNNYKEKTMNIFSPTIGKPDENSKEINIKYESYNLCENYEDYRPTIVTWPNFSLNYTYDNRGIPEFIKPNSKEDYNCFIKSEESSDNFHHITAIGVAPFVRLSNKYIISNDIQKVYKIEEYVFSDDEKILSKSISYKVIPTEEEYKIADAFDKTYDKIDILMKQYDE